MFIAVGETDHVQTPYTHHHCHRRDYYLSGVILDGGIDFRSESGTTHRHAPGISLTAPGITYHMATHPPQHRLHNIWLIFHPWPALRPLLNIPHPISGHGWLDLHSHPHTEEILDAYRDILRWSRSPRPQRDALAKNAMERAWLLLADGRASEHPHPDRLMDKALAYIHDHLSHPLTVDMLASEVDLSPSWFAHRFQEEIGQSPMACVEMLRMEEAKSLLLRSDYAIKEIAALVGYESPYYFSSRFRSVIGVSPTAFRSRHE